MPMARTWNGLTIQDKAHRAAGRAVIGIGMATAVEAKRLTHVVSGTLSRSIHFAPLMEMHDDDQSSAAAGADLLMTAFHTEATFTKTGPAIEVGSWLDYACVEWVGRRHPGIIEAMDSVRGIQADRIVAQAFREEGLK